MSSQVKGLTSGQRDALATLEREHGMFDYMAGDKSKPAVFVDFNTRSEGYRSFRIERDGTCEDVTEAMLLGDDGE